MAIPYYSLLDISSRKGMPKEYLPYPKSQFIFKLQYKDMFIHNITTQRLKNAINKAILLPKLTVMHKTQRMFRSSVKNKALVPNTSKCVYELTYGTMLIYTHKGIFTKMVTAKHLLDNEHSVDLNIAFKVINKQMGFKSLLYVETCTIRLHQLDLCVQKQMVVE